MTQLSVEIATIAIAAAIQFAMASNQPVNSQQKIVNEKKKQTKNRTTSIRPSNMSCKH